MASDPRIVYQRGDHVCSLFFSPEEQFATAVEYVRGGLQRRERCLYVCCEHTKDEFRDGLRARGIDVAAAEARGALQVLTKHEGHLKTGAFDVEGMIDLLDKAVHDAIADGYAWLCAAGDMTWLLDGAPGSEQVVEYEARLNDFYSSRPALGLCQYNRRKLPTALLEHGIATHRFVRIDGRILLHNPFYEPPPRAMRRAPEPHRFDEKIRALSSLDSR